MPSNHLILYHPLLQLPSVFPSIRVFSNESTLCMRWPKYWSFTFSIISSKEIHGWSPSERTGWISLQSKGPSRGFSNTTVQRASILRCSAFFTVQLSHPYMTTGKTIALTRRTFVGKVMSLLLNVLSRRGLSEWQFLHWNSVSAWVPEEKASVVNKNKYPSFKLNFRNVCS